MFCVFSSTFIFAFRFRPVISFFLILTVENVKECMGKTSETETLNAQISWRTPPVSVFYQNSRHCGGSRKHFYLSKSELPIIPLGRFERSFPWGQLKRAISSELGVSFSGRFLSPSFPTSLERRVSYSHIYSTVSIACREQGKSVNSSLCVYFWSHTLLEISRNNVVVLVLDKRMITACSSCSVGKHVLQMSLRLRDMFK